MPFLGNGRKQYSLSKAVCFTLTGPDGLKTAQLSSNEVCLPICIQGQSRGFETPAGRVEPLQYGSRTGPSRLQTWGQRLHCSKRHPGKLHNVSKGKALSPLEGGSYLVVVGIEVFEVLPRLGVSHSSAKRGNKIPQKHWVVDISSDLKLRWRLFLGEQVDNLSAKVCPLLGIGKDVVAGVKSSQSRVVVVVNLNRGKV